MQFAVTERGGLYRGLVRDVNFAREVKPTTFDIDATGIATGIACGTRGVERSGARRRKRDGTKGDHHSPRRPAANPLLHETLRGSRGHLGSSGNQQHPKPEV